MIRKDVLVVGGTGFIGSALCEALIKKGYRVMVLSRHRQRKNTAIKYLQWDPMHRTKQFESIKTDIVINLAGEGIADRRWSTERKKAIRSSRVNTTDYLFEIIHNQEKLPAIYIGASATGYYGNQYSKTLDENFSSQSTGFLENVCKEWEEGHMKFQRCTDRVVIFRIGIVLSIKGGALPKMMMPLKWGLGAYFGSGHQYYSWIHLHDLVNMILTSLEHPNAEGIYNAVSPQPVNSRYFAKALSHTSCNRKILLQIPSWFMKILFGEMSSTLLYSARVLPARIRELGFEFKYQELILALEDLGVQAN